MPIHAVDAIAKRIPGVDPWRVFHSMKEAIASGQTRTIVTMDNGKRSIMRVMIDDDVAYPVVITDGGNRSGQIKTVLIPGMVVKGDNGAFRLARDGARPITNAAYARKKLRALRRKEQSADEMEGDT
jgi:hypothetical protein